MALVATVVPCAIALGGAPPAASSARRSPPTSASAGSEGVLGTFRRRVWPSSATRTRSVKVPPVSIPTRTGTPSTFARAFAGRPSGGPGAPPEEEGSADDDQRHHGRDDLVWRDRGGDQVHAQWSHGDESPPSGTTADGGRRCRGAPTRQSIPTERECAHPSPPRGGGLGRGGMTLPFIPPLSRGRA